MPIETAKSYQCVFSSLYFRRLKEKYTNLQDVKADYLSFYQEAKCSLDAYVIEEINFNGYPAIKATFCDPTGESGYMYDIALIQGENVLVISVPEYYFPNSDKKINQILSTFKFTR